MPTTPTGDLYDFSNPFVSAVIVTKDGRFPLWTNNPQNLISEKGGNATSTRALSFLTDITVEIQLAFLPKITATLTPPYRDAINFLDSPLMNWGTSQLEVTFGYISRTTSNVILAGPFTGVLLKPEVTLGQDVSIVLSAQGMGGLSAAHQAGTRSFNKKTRFEIIEAIAEGRTSEVRPEDLTKDTSRVSFSPTIDAVNVDAKEPSIDPRRRAKGSAIAGTIRTPESTGGETKLGQKTRNLKVDAKAVKEGEDKSAHDKLFKEPRTYAQGGKSDWTAIWELATEAGCYFVWEGNEVKLYPQNRKFSGSETVRDFTLYDYPGGQIGPANGTFPILSASSPTMAVYLPGATKGLVNLGVNPDTRKSEVVSVNDGSEKQPRINPGGGAPSTEMGYAPANDKTGDGQATFPGESSDPDVKTMMQAEYAALSSTMGINLTIETLADPKLKPGDVIKVNGLGERLSKNYWIIKLTYNFGASGASMSMEAVSNSAHVEKMVKGEGQSPKFKSSELIAGDGVVVSPDDRDKRTA